MVLIDVKVNYNSDVKIFKSGAMFIPGATSIPESTVFKNRFITEKEAIFPFSKS